MSPRKPFRVFPVVQVITCVAAAGLLAQAAFSQGRGGAAGAPAGGGGTTGGVGPGAGSNTPGTSLPSTTGIPGNNGNTNNTPQPTGLPQPVPITGRVLLEDGTAPTQTVTIERVCGGSPHAEGYTDTKGYFFLQLGSRENGVMQDASETDGFGSRNSGRQMGMGGGTPMGRGMESSDMRWSNCELRAKLAGYRSQNVSLVNHRALDNPDIGTILLHRLGPDEGTTVNARALEIPKDARKAFDKAQEAVKKGKLEDAQKNYSKAVELYRPYAAAWFELGRMQAAAGDLYTARGSFGEALKADPKFVPAYVAMADMDAKDRKWKDVAEITDRASKLDSFDYPQVYFYNAVANFNEKNLEVAEKSAERAVRLDTRHQFPQVYYLMGMIKAIHQDYTAAAENFRTYLKLQPDATDAASAKKQLEQVEKILAQAKPEEPKEPH
jgi:tetratricopeptide (TPR) repeat protein